MFNRNGSDSYSPFFGSFGTRPVGGVFGGGRHPSGSDSSKASTFGAGGASAFGGGGTFGGGGASTFGVGGAFGGGSNSSKASTFDSGGGSAFGGGGSAAAQRTAEEKQRQEQLEAQRARLAEIKRLEESRIAAENAQKLVAAEKEALAQERLRAEQERRQWEEQKNRYEEERAEKARTPESSSANSSSESAGASLSLKKQAFGRPPSVFVPSNQISAFLHFYAAHDSIKNYRANRENGFSDDNLTSFPDSGFSILEVKTVSNAPQRYPDSTGKYYWLIECQDGRVIKDFYWMPDKKLGFPDSSGRFNYTVYGPNGVELSGFSLGPDSQKPPATADGTWYSFDYTENGLVQRWMEEKDKNFIARAKAEEESIGRVNLMIPFEELSLKETLGKGGFGIVHRAEWHGGSVAVKQLLSQTLAGDLKKEFLNEASVMMNLRHMNIVQLYGVSLNPYAIVMEFLSRGSLDHFLYSSEPLSPALQYGIVLDVGKGLAFLHSKHVLHRDLKSLNVLLDEYYKAKLSDFGLSKIKASSSQTYGGAGAAGTTQWMAPELFEPEARYTTACDVYSYGMLVWEVLSRQRPYRNTSHPSLIPIHVAKGHRETIPSDSPKVLSRITSVCWDQEAQKRPAMSDVTKYLGENVVEDNTPRLSPHVQDSKADKMDAPSARSSGSSGLRSKSSSTDVYAPSRRTAGGVESELSKQLGSSAFFKSTPQGRDMQSSVKGVSDRRRGQSSSSDLSAYGLSAKRG